jgi:hypothetical protein
VPDEVPLPASSDVLDAHRGAITDLVARYVEAVACFDVELYRAVWADDAVWVVDGRGEFHGPDAITELFARLRGRQELAVQRVMSGRVLGVEVGEATSAAGAATATGRWIIHSVTRTAGAGEELIGIYDDRYRHEGGGWRFTQRAFRPLYRGPRELPGRVWTPAGTT